MSRVVLTAPWKLGLFVFTLVLGCGFGLVYSYLSLFGGTLDFQDDESVKAFFMVCGGVAMMALLGYLGVVTQARPLDKVIRGSSKRANLMKRFGEIEDPREVDLHQFAETPELKRILERWRQDTGTATNVQAVMATQREAIQSLAVKVQTASHSQDAAVSTDSDEMQPLAHAINQLIHDLRDTDVEGPAVPDDERVALGRSLVDLRQHQAQLSGFAASVAASSEELSRRAQANLAGPEALPQGQGAAGLSPESIQKIAMVLDQNAGGLQEIATQLDRGLAELVARVDPSAEHHAPPAPAPVAPAAPLPVDSAPAFVADAFEAVAAPPPAPEPAPVAAPPRAFDRASRPVQVSEPAPAPPRASAPVDRLPVDSPAGHDEKVYDLADLGAVEMPADDPEARIYDLSEFGAVEV